MLSNKSQCTAVVPPKPLYKVNQSHFNILGTSACHSWHRVAYSISIKTLQIDRSTMSNCTSALHRTHFSDQKCGKIEYVREGLHRRFQAE